MRPCPPTNAHDVPVLVVGAGPAGLAAAIELARHDIPSLLVERRTALSSHPRATVLSLRSMELVRAWGLEAAVRARSVDVDWRMLESETLADAAAGTALPVGYPSPEQSRMVSPTAPACVAQDDLEPLLLEHLRAAPQARVAARNGADRRRRRPRRRPRATCATCAPVRCARCTPATSWRPTARAARCAVRSASR